jgi:alkylation response protein AidB-like acyl-CoA dehydrogenase
VFHLFAGALGPDNAGILRSIVEGGRWVSFPAGAGSGVHGVIEGDDRTGRAVLDGVAAFGTGARYGDHCGVVFAVVGDDGRPVRPLDLRFTLVDNDAPGVKIDPTWDGSGLRASATDDVHYEGVEVELSACARWFGANRAESLRTVPVIDHRYREDWVGLSDLWLGWMAVGVVREALRFAVSTIVDRRVIMGAKMVERPTVQINLGRALALTASARAAVAEACHEVDRRIDAGQVPDTADYFRQQAIVTMAVDQLSRAVDLLVTTLGGNGLREGSELDRRLRDFRAMPLHINVHQDRISHQLGRLALGVDLDPF